MASVEELETELRILIEIHERLRQPWTDVNDVKGWLTHRKNDVRRRIKAQKRVAAP